MTALIELLTQARQAGLTLTRIHGGRGEEDTLRVRGPRSAEHLVKELLGRKKDVLTTVNIYNGLVTCLDWRKGRISDKPEPCFLCGRPTVCIEPWDGRQCHKACAEAAISTGVMPASKKGKAA